MTALYFGLDETPQSRKNLRQVCTRLGVNLTTVPGTTPYVLSMVSSGAKTLVKMPGVNFMSETALDILADSLKRGLFMKALPVAIEAADLDLIGSGPVFVKPRLNFYKSKHPLAYTRYASAADVPDAVWEADVGPALSSLVALPDCGNPLTVVEVDFAVNEQSEVKVMHVFTHIFDDHNKPGFMCHREDWPENLIDDIQEFCQHFEVKGGIYDVQAVLHNGVWKVMDWNTRPSAMYQIMGGVPGFLDAGLAHMMDLPDPGVVVPYFEARSFWDNPIPNTKAGLLTQAGLVPSWVWEKSAICRIYATGESAEDVQEKFDHLTLLLEEE